jgi:hypothetical protein
MVARGGGSCFLPLLRAVLREQAVERLLLPDSELTRLNARVVDAQEGVNVVHRLRAHVRELLDLGRRVLDLFVGQLEVKLLNARLDGIPAC